MVTRWASEINVGIDTPACYIHELTTVTHPMVLEHEHHRTTLALHTVVAVHRAEELAVDTEHTELSRHIRVTMGHCTH